MRSNTDVYIHAKKSSRLEKLADKYWDQRSRLLLCVKPRLNTARVNSVCLDNPAVGSLWVPARFKNGNTADRRLSEKAICAYFNSTLGWLSMIGVASTKNVSRPDLSIDALRQLRVPVLNPAMREALAEAFDAAADTPLDPLQNATGDPTRVALDNAVADALGVDQETVIIAREELAREPSVVGH